ncbi:MAG: hypothetical protein QW692_06300, partial [Nitrososphaerota archaeon]
MKALKEIEEIEEKAPWVIRELSLEDLGVREVAGSNPARSKILLNGLGKASRDMSFGNLEGNGLSVKE